MIVFDLQCREGGETFEIAALNAVVEAGHGGEHNVLFQLRLLVP